MTGFCKKQVRQRLTARQRLAAGLRHRRQQKDLSQLDLAAKLESSKSWVAKMEAGDPSVSLDLLIRSLIALGTTERELSQIITLREPPKVRLLSF